jgi:hypothetical protein
MRKLTASWILLALGGLVGCTNEHPGGPGAAQGPHKTPTYTKEGQQGTQRKSAYGPEDRDTRKTSTFGREEGTFTIGVPQLSTSIKQGETKTISISIKRGKNFDQDVKLAFGDLPKGVTIEPSMETIKASETEKNISIKATDDAAVGEFTVKVTGTPTTGANAESDLKLNVNKK